MENTHMMHLLAARTATSSLGRYGVIYADPPWQFNVWSRPAKDAYNKDGRGGELRGGRSAEDYYSTIPIGELCALPVSDLAAADCTLFMWATWPTLPDALKLGAAWGFEYKTLAFDWLKRSPNGGSWHTGMGYWTRANSEPCLLFTKGNPKRKSKGVKQLIPEVGQQELFPPIVEPLTVHSAKPFEAYRRIEALLDGPYLELFARIAWPGWDVWGNEAPNSIDWQRSVLAGARPVETNRTLTEL
jgi:N6-adenosine-specific RNA methylase IME4